MVKAITELAGKELFGKKVLLRVDFNVPMENGKISETYRIKANKETINFLINRGAIIGLVSHITAINSFEPILNQVKEVLSIDLDFINEYIGESVGTGLNSAKPGDAFLLENVRKYEGEEKNNINFAKNLADPFDLYVNNAFSASHRNHASLVAVTKFLPSYAGSLLLKEIFNLGKILKSPKEDKTLIIGGNKIDTKLPVIKNFIDKAEYILIGGAITENMFEKNSRVIFPKDYISENGVISDIGPETVKEFANIINSSKIIIWNGPLGKVEEEKFSIGSKKISEAIINSGAFSIVGGGDTIAFIEKMGLMDKFSYISTGGGAMLEFLAGDELPGLLALGYE